MDFKKITGIFIGVILVICIIYDVWALASGGTAASISHYLIVASYKYPIMTFAAGVLCGHLFWRVRGTKELRQIEDDTRK